MSIVESTAVNLVDDPPQYAGRIHFGDWQVRVPCIVKDVSGTSATLHLFGAKQLPSLIWLSIHEPYV